MAVAVAHGASVRCNGAMRGGSLGPAAHRAHGRAWRHRGSADGTRPARAGSGGADSDVTITAKRRCARKEVVLGVAHAMAGGA